MAGFAPGLLLLSGISFVQIPASVVFLLGVTFVYKSLSYNAPSIMKAHFSSRLGSNGAPNYKS